MREIAAVRGCSCPGRDFLIASAAEETSLMHFRLIALLTLACLAWGGAGCTNRWNSDTDEVLMPLQTGSVLHRRVRVPAEKDKKPTKKKKKESSRPKAEAEPSPTPAPEEESTPPADRFR
jgi:hypothetical protein